MRVRTRKALTLIELLVVVSIIAVLIGLITPALARARSGAGTLRCQTNLHQWAMAASLYAQVNDGFLPRRGQGAQATTIINRAEDWFNALPLQINLPSYWQLARVSEVPQPGDKSLWMCPAAEPVLTQNYFAYGMNMRLSTTQAEQPDKIDRVAPTDRQVLLADGPGGHCSVLPANKPYSPTARHRGTINIAFLDGHAGTFPGDYVGCGVGDPLRGDVQWVVPGSSWTGPGN
jgi:prepilin-type processing-associated H-X9-DG protein/prepilin-type N-terminal cleavage/methylation domain-containing protein